VGNLVVFDAERHHVEWIVQALQAKSHLMMNLFGRSGATRVGALVSVFFILEIADFFVYVSSTLLWQAAGSFLLSFLDVLLS
jgi:hypothetical protein